MDSPLVPLELKVEFIIFTAYRLQVDFKSLKAWNLRLISKPIQAGLDRILFASLYIRSSRSFDSIFRTLEGKPSRFVTDTVRHVFLSASVDNMKIERLLLLCKGTKSFISHREPPLKINDCVPRYERLILADPFLIPSFPYLTHLELLNGFWDNGCQAQLAALPRLTRLALNSAHAQTFEGNVERVIDFVSSCRRLEMLLLLVYKEDVVSTREMLNLVATSPRIFVWTHQRMPDNWVDYLNGEDIWVKAKRRCNDDPMVDGLG